MPAGRGDEALGEAENGLGAAEIKHAIGRQPLGDRLQHPALGRLIEIDQHVAAENGVELAERAEIGEQIPLPEADHGAERFGDPPALLLLAEMLDQRGHRHPALDLELGV